MKTEEEITSNKVFSLTVLLFDNLLQLVWNISTNASHQH